MSGKRSHVFSGSIYEEMAGDARAVVVDDRIFVSGTVGVDFETGEVPAGAGAQTALALQTIENALTEAGSGANRPSPRRRSRRLRRNRRPDWRRSTLNWPRRRRS